MADLPSYRQRMADEGHEAIAAPLRKATDDLAETVALLAEQYAGQQETFFLADLLFELLGSALDEITALTERVTKLETPPTAAVHI